MKNTRVMDDKLMYFFNKKEFSGEMFHDLFFARANWSAKFSQIWFETNSKIENIGQKLDFSNNVH